VYLTANREVLRSRIRRVVAPTDRIVKLEVVDRLADEMDAFFFSYDEAPLLVINTSELDGDVEHPKHIEEFINVIRNARAGVQHYRPMRSR